MSAIGKNATLGLASVTIEGTELLSDIIILHFYIIFIRYGLFVIAIVWFFHEQLFWKRFYFIFFYLWLVVVHVNIDSWIRFSPTYTDARIYNIYILYYSIHINIWSVQCAERDDKSKQIIHYGRFNNYLTSLLINLEKVMNNNS